MKGDQKVALSKMEEEKSSLLANRRNARSNCTIEIVSIFQIGQKVAKQSLLFAVVSFSVPKGVVLNIDQENLRCLIYHNIFSFSAKD